jgi:hypothetical protein
MQNISDLNGNVGTEYHTLALSKSISNPSIFQPFVLLRCMKIEASSAATKGPELIVSQSTFTSTTTTIKFDKSGTTTRAVYNVGVISMLIDTTYIGGNPNINFDYTSQDGYHARSTTLTDKLNAYPANFGLSDSLYSTTQYNFDGNCFAGLYAVFVHLE